MKKLYLVIIEILTANTIVLSQVAFYPKFGANLSWTTYDFKWGGSTSIKTPAHLGIYGGIAVDIPLNNQFSIRPEFIYNQFNTSRNREVGPNYSDSKKEDRRYLTVPVTFIWHIKISKSDLQIGLGPSISLGLNGGSYKEKTIEVYNGIVYETNQNGKLSAGKVPLPWAENAGYYNPLDFGIDYGIGYQVKRFLFSQSFIWD